MAICPLARTLPHARRARKAFGVKSLRSDERRRAAVAGSGADLLSCRVPSRAFQESQVMAKQCDICGKGTVTGRNISHAHNVTSRTWEPNLQRVRAIIDGTVRRV